MTDNTENTEGFNFRSTPVVDTGTGTNLDDENYFADIEPVTAIERPVNGDLAHFERPTTGVVPEHVFITDLDFIERESVEYEDTLRKYAESLKTGHSVKVSL